MQKGPSLIITGEAKHFDPLESSEVMGVHRIMIALLIQY